MPEAADAISDIEHATTDAIVSLFESGSTARYGAVAHSATDRGKLSYGKHQASRTSGHLAELIEKYCSSAGAVFADELRPYLPAMRDTQHAPIAIDSDAVLRNLLKQAGYDPVMQRVQDAYFFETFMQPALATAKQCGFATALARAVVYDSSIHGSWPAMKAETEKVAGAPSAANEKQWIAAYVDTRRNWLATNSNPDLRKTTYRMDTMKALIAADAWDLPLPLPVTLTGASYKLTAWDLPDTVFPDPIRRGLDPNGIDAITQATASQQVGLTRHVQSLLAQLSYLDRTGADGRFGPGTLTAVKNFQSCCGVPINGEIDAPTFMQLCDAVQKHNLAPLPERERNGTSRTTSTAGTVVGGLGAGAVVVGEVVSPAQQATAPAADVAQTAASPSVATVPAAPSAPVDTTQLHFPVLTAHEWWLWLAVGLLMLALLFFTISRRRSY